jgi:hypothetical protein
LIAHFLDVFLLGFSNLRVVAFLKSASPAAVLELPVVLCESASETPAVLKPNSNSNRYANADTDPNTSIERINLQWGNGIVNGTILISGKSYTVTAQENTITKSVVFSRDGAVVKTDSAIPFDFTWIPGATGTHTFVATPWTAAGGREVAEPLLQ